jgi:outer membrane protein OmpA-like peptidoglycan-associated protein
MLQAQELAKVLADKSGDFKKALIIGHTDVRGDEEYNQDLSQRRAESVVSLLEQWRPELKGRLKPKGKGERKPKYPGEEDDDHRRNRRVEVQLH